MTNNELQWEIQENKNKVQENKEEIILIMTILWHSKLIIIKIIMSIN